MRRQESLDTRNWSDGPDIPSGTTFEAAWRDLDHVDTPDDDLRKRGFAHGAVRFAREEGMWYGEDPAYVACTNSGKNVKGQIWRYVLSPPTRAQIVKTTSPAAWSSSWSPTTRSCWRTLIT